MDGTTLIEEAAFADEDYSKYASDLAINHHMFAKYQAPRQMWDWRQRAAKLLGDLAGKRLLDFGCGMGEEAVYFAKLGASVTAVDVSTVGIQITRDRANFNEVSDRVDARVMNVAPTDFPNDSFDVIHGLGILHHVGINQGLKEVHRLLRPGGTAIFLEPLGNSALVERIKRSLHQRCAAGWRLTPVTSGEENLRLADINRECRRFARHRLYPYRLVYRGRKLFIPKSLWTASLCVDQLLLALCPPLRHFAGAAVLHVVK